MDIDKFEVSADGKMLYIAARVPDGPNYEDITIGKVAVNTEYQSFSGMFPVAPAWEVEVGAKEFVINLAIKELVVGCPSLRGKKPLMFFLYVKQEGIPAEETPCCCDKEVTIAHAVNLLPLYREAVYYFKRYLEDCEKYKSRLLDIYLRKNILLDMLRLGHYDVAIEFFMNYLSRDLHGGHHDGDVSPSIHRCCHG
jgi:hypothetical protein